MRVVASAEGNCPSCQKPVSDPDDESFQWLDKQLGPERKGYWREIEAFADRPAEDTRIPSAPLGIPTDQVQQEGVLEIVPENNQEGISKESNPFQSPGMAASLSNRPASSYANMSMLDRLRQRTGGEQIYLALFFSITGTLLFFLYFHPRFVVFGIGMHILAVYMLYRVKASGSRPTRIQLAVGVIPLLWSGLIVLALVLGILVGIVGALLSLFFPGRF